jgi:hypothetical protein
LGDLVNIYNTTDQWQIMNIMPDEIYLIGKEDPNRMGPDYAIVGRADITLVSNLYE